MHETSEFVRGWVGGVWVEGYGVGDGGGVILCVCVCPYCSVVKNVFVVLKVCWAPLLLLLLLLLFFFSTSILPHTFEPLCGIVPWSWLGSLLPRPRLPPGQLAHAPQIRCCQPGHGSEARSPESSEARGACPPSMREPELLLSQFRTRRVGG